MVGSTTLESFHATGGLTVNSQGLIAVLQATQDTPFTQSYGFSIDASFLLEANTTGQPQTVGSIGLPAGNYAEVHGVGTLQLGSFVAAGTFDFSYQDSALMIHADATEALGPLGTAAVGGDLTIQGGSSPGVYGDFHGSIATADTLPGIHLAAAAQLFINSTSTPQIVSAFTVNPDGTTGTVHPVSIPTGFSLQSGGTLTIDGLFGMSIAGEFEVSFDSSNIDLHAAATLSGFLGTHLGVTADVHVLAGDSAGSGGLVIDASLSLGSSFGYGPLSISATPSLLVNTTSADRYGVAKDTYEVELANASFNVAGFQASGTLMVGVNNSVFSIQVPSNDSLSVSFFGLGSLGVYGYLDSNGQFSLNGSIGFDFEAVGTGLYGSISASLSNSGFAGSFDATAKIAGQDVASVGGSLVIETNHVHVVAWAQLGILPPVKIDFDLGAAPVPANPSTIYWFSVPGTATEGATVTLNSAANDPGGVTLSPDADYQWSVTRNGQPFANGNGAAFPVALGDPGTYQATLTVLEPDGSRLQKSGTINVTDIAPTITGLNLQGAYASGIRQAFAPSVLNHGSAPLTYTWSVTRNGAAFSPSDATYSGSTFTFTPPAPNSASHASDAYTITLIATDPYGGRSTTTGNFVVLDPSNATVDTTLDNGTGLSLRAAITAELQVPSPYAIHFAEPGGADDPAHAGRRRDRRRPRRLAIPSGKTITIDASNVPGITINAESGATKRIFYVATNATLNLTSVALRGGVAFGSEAQARGGAIDNNGTVNLQSCSVIGNRATGVAQDSFNGVQPDGQGGAIYSTWEFSAYNSTFASNVATGGNGDFSINDRGGSGRGGAIANDGGSLLLYGCTIADNSANAGANSPNPSYGGGVYEAAVDWSRYLDCDIFSGDVVVQANRAQAADDYDSFANAFYSYGGSNIVSAPGIGVAPGLILTTTNPLLGPLADHGNGLPTFSLLPGSPALGAGFLAFGEGPLDGRGMPRMVGGKVDIGTFEHQSYVVSNLNDSGPGSLRALIAIDDDGSPISFAPTLSPGKLTLTSGPIVLSSSLTITGPGASLLTIDGGGSSRIFTVNQAATVGLSGLTLADGRSSQAGDTSLDGSEGGAHPEQRHPDGHQLLVLQRHGDQHALARRRRSDRQLVRRDPDGHRQHLRPRLGHRARRHRHVHANRPRRRDLQRDARDPHRRARTRSPPARRRRAYPDTGPTAT